MTTDNSCLMPPFPAPDTIKVPGQKQPQPVTSWGFIHCTVCFNCTTSVFMVGSCKLGVVNCLSEGPVWHRVKDPEEFLRICSLTPAEVPSDWLTAQES